MPNRTPLYEEHVKLNGTIVDFAGWELPVQYTRLIEEHEATRERAGLFDICHMGEFDVTGSGAFEFLQHALSRDLSPLKPGRCVYSTMLNERGGCVDDLFVYMKGSDSFMLVVNAANIKKDFDWLETAARGRDVSLADRSSVTAKLDLQGPESAAIMRSLCSAELPSRFGFVSANVAGVETLVSRTGYTGEDGFELYCESGRAVELWRAIIEAGTPLGLLPCGLGARDTLRLEAAYSLYGHELSDDISPVEAGLRFAVSTAKDFIGSDVVKKQLAAGAPRQSVAFALVERGVPRDGCEVVANGSPAGRVASGTFSPTLKKGIGLALLNSPAASIGDSVSVIIRNRPYAAEIVARPFIAYRGGSK
jgi:aminomethyltransferase